jgi:hypothetical protein
MERAAQIAGASTISLRQCFYILVSEGAIPNTDTSYKRLSALTAEARREGRFPSFIDGTRGVTRAGGFDGPLAAIRAAVRGYHRDRAEGQSWQVWVAGEKRTLANQLWRWFGGLGFPIVVCAGYASQTLCDDVRGSVESDGRDSVLVYAGDFDPSGEDIDRDFVERVGVFDEVVRVAVTADQVEALGLPPLPGKASDARAAAFEARHGRLVQVEVEAVHPETLRGLYQDAIDRYWDESAFEAVLTRESKERETLLAFADEFSEGAA